MGDSRNVVVLPRAVACAVIGAAAVLALTSCALLGGTPGTPTPSDTAPVRDPSIPSATAVPTDSAMPTASPTATDATTLSPAPDPSTATPVDSRTVVAPFITSAVITGGELNVSAIVPKVVESSGTCTVIATRAGVERTATAAAAAASTYMGCQPLRLTGLAAGTWQVQVRYTSTRSAGTSASRTVTPT